MTNTDALIKRSYVVALAKTAAAAVAAQARVESAIVEARTMGGLSLREIAELVGYSHETVRKICVEESK